MRRSVVVGSGAHLPERVVTNQDLSKLLDTSDQWIIERTGIRQRHVAGEDEKTSDLAVRAVDKALTARRSMAPRLRPIVMATTTPDETFPATATIVQSELGIDQAAAFDVQAVCAGFIFALATADSMIRTGQAENAVIIGAETLTRLLDWKDRSTSVLFGDGAGAVVLRAEEGQGTSDDRGILSCHLHTDGRLRNVVYVDGGVSLTGTAGHMVMPSGPELFRHAVEKLTDVLREALEANDLDPGDVDWFVPHQANERIINGTAKRFQIPRDKVVLTIDRHANTSAASIPLALDEAVTDGRIKEGDVLLLEGIGSGLSWGSSLVRW